MAAITLPINATLAVGTHPLGPITMADSTHSEATLTIDRTGTGGLNSLTSSSTLTVSMQYSTDGGQTWTDVASYTVVGGVFITKGGVTETINALSFGIGQPFQAGWQVRSLATVAGPSSITVAQTSSLVVT